MGQSRINKYDLLLICLLLAACSGTKHLPAGEKLYTGAVVKLESTDHIKNKRYLKTIAKNAIRPLPNKSFLGMRPKVWMYMKSENSSKKGLNKWFNKNGEEPVIMSNINQKSTSSIIDAKFFNIGIFNSLTEYQIVEKKHTAKVIYICHVHTPYTIKELTYSISDDNISHALLSDKKNSLLKSGDVYNLDLLKAERLRIDLLLKNKGYFYFSPEYLLFKSDTTETDHTIALRLTLKMDVPKNALTAYRINKVFIDQNYSLNSDTSRRVKDTIRYQNCIFLGKASERTIRPGVILRSVYLRHGEIYTRNNHDITLNRLMSMGNFKFVSVKFTDSDTLAPGYLNVTILMTPMTKRTFSAEIDFISKSNNFMGPRMDFSYLNRNTFHGAELLNMNLAGSFEAQVGVHHLFSYSLAPQAELSFPGILVPFKIIRTNSLYAPKTLFSLSYNYMKRVNYFDMQTFQFTYGFKWKQNRIKEQELNPVMISFASLSNKSTAFTDLLVANPYLEKSYEEQFIAGGSYALTFNEQLGPERNLQYYLHLTAETAGNVLSLAKAITGEKRASDHPSTVFGSAYSQYAKLSVDGRAYYLFADKNKLAVRFFVGVAKPYGNASVLPYSKQFFSGGPNSLRAFSINSVGPGSYHQNTGNSGFSQMGGDVKLETNAEYRFGIYSFLKGALFVDAGNVWLLQSNPTLLIDPFSFSRFTSEIAVGTGFGLRIDVNFFILRFDLAMPLRTPWLEDNQHWVIHRINFSDPSWRSDNLVLNVAIGYPF
ncbi:MAG: BamA/TamA family outer membrane protein [Bacteroidales bacterium]|nr:BamA/TamA family outer membrane protein [Bacteroidales bacterium]